MQTAISFSIISHHSFHKAPKRSIISKRYNSLRAAQATPIEKNFNELINDQIREYPVKSFIVDTYQHGYRYDYRESRKKIDMLAKGLMERVHKGVIATALPLNLESIYLQIAAARVGKVTALFDSVITAEKLEEQFQNIDPGTFFCKPTQGDRKQMAELIKYFPWLTKSDSDESLFYDRRYPNLKEIFQMDKIHYPNTRHMSSILSKGTDNDELKRFVIHNSPNVRDVTAIVKDGTENFGLSQYNIINTGYFVGQAIGLKQEDIILSTVPLHLSAGLSLGIGMTLSHRAQIVLAYPEFNTEATFDALDEEYVTTLVGLASQFEQLLSTETKKKANNLNKVLVVATPGDLPSVSLLEKYLI